MAPFDPDLDARPKHPPLCVLKFGGSVLTHPDDYAQAASETYRHLRQGEKVLVIVSALNGETSALYDASNLYGVGGSDATKARLIRLGEFRSAALMGLALERIGVRTAVVDPHEIGLMAEGRPLDADVSDLDVPSLLEKIDQADAVVIPGFTAGHRGAGAAVLGRGGTDLTAVTLGAKVGAQRVRLIKDVDGIYTDDPAANRRARRYGGLDYDTALLVSKGVIQDKAIQAAKSAGVALEIAAMGAADATQVRPGPAALTSRVEPVPVNLALLGCGAVGSGVLDHARSRSDLFSLNPILVRNAAARARDDRARFVSDPAAALGGSLDIAVEMMGGADEPALLMERLLGAGVNVVTANKAAVAKHYDAPHAAARRGRARLRYSAAVGGGAPVIETVRRLAPHGIAKLEGVMNGTANFILSKLADGVPFADALEEAQRLGFAEADPSADIEGQDAAEKLSILIREGFERAVSPDQIPKASLADMTPELCREAAKRGAVYKQVARAELDDDGQITAEIVIEAVALNHPFAHAINEHNCVHIWDLDLCRHEVFGKGAGRWPTAAAVFADIMDLHRALTADGGTTSAMVLPSTAVDLGVMGQGEKA